MKLRDFIEHLGNGNPVQSGSEIHKNMCKFRHEAMQRTCQLNGSYHYKRGAGKHNCGGSAGKSYKID